MVMILIVMVVCVCTVLATRPMWRDVTPPHTSALVYCTVRKCQMPNPTPIMLTSTSSGLDHPSPSFHVSLTCEFVGRNSNPNSAQGVSNLAVPGSFLAVVSVVDICNRLLLLLMILLLLFLTTALEMGCWKASQNDTVANNAASMDLLLLNIMIILTLSSNFWRNEYWNDYRNAILN